MVAAVTGGRLHGPDVPIDGVSFDSRSIQPGQLFVPLVADRDGHEFIAAASARGAAAYLTSAPPVGGTAIEVPDTLRALMALAAAQRRSFDGPVVGVTGSVGKTSTKDLAWVALAASLRTWANERSFNNEQGLPTTLLNTPDLTEVLILEMGMRGAGEIAELCEIARPTIGVVTRVAEAHSDRLGGIDGVARDSADADVRISLLHLDDIARPSFHLDTPWGSCEVHLGVSGRHMAHNAAAALACAGAVGADLQAAAAALVDVGLTAMRMEVSRTAAGATVLNNSYNANPTRLMAEISNPGDEHRAVLEYAHGRGIEVLAYGTDLYGIEPTTDPVGALGSLAGGDAVLVKASRVVGLERIAAALLG